MEKLRLEVAHNTVARKEWRFGRVLTRKHGQGRSAGGSVECTSEVVGEMRLLLVGECGCDNGNRDIRHFPSACPERSAVLLIEPEPIDSRSPLHFLYVSGTPRFPGYFRLYWVACRANFPLIKLFYFTVEVEIRRSLMGQLLLDKFRST